LEAFHVAANLVSESIKKRDKSGLHTFWIHNPTGPPISEPSS